MKNMPKNVIVEIIVTILSLFGHTVFFLLLFHLFKYYNSKFNVEKNVS